MSIISGYIVTRFLQALVACRLYKSLAKEAAEDYLEVEICDELRNYAE